MRSRSLLPRFSGITRGHKGPLVSPTNHFLFFPGVKKKGNAQKKFTAASRVATRDAGSGFPPVRWRRGECRDFPQAGVGTVSPIRARPTCPWGGWMDRQMRFLRWRERTRTRQCARGVRPIRDTPDRGGRAGSWWACHRHASRLPELGGPCVRRRRHHDCTAVDSSSPWLPAGSAVLSPQPDNFKPQR